jgi:aldehyde dehydrogenase (NAD+)
VCGGHHDVENLFLEPTIITNVAPDAEIMKEEIFGPILPVIAWQNEEEVYKMIQQQSNPLALYVFTSSRAKE